MSKTKKLKENSVLEVEILPPEEEEEKKEVEGFEDLLTTENIDELVIESEEEGEEELKSLTKYDPLASYLNEIRRYKPLSKEEEFETALNYYQTKDIQSAYKLITNNLWLVVKIAREYERAARSLLDIVQEGNMGLMEAVKNFDPYKGARFPSYAAWWVKAYILRYLIANWRLVKIGTTQAQRKLFFNLKKEKERLEREGFDPMPKLLADRLNVRESDVTEMEQRLSSPDVSVDAPTNEDSDSNLLSILPSSGDSAEQILSKKEFRKTIDDSLKEFALTLKEKEMAILSERLLSDEKATLQDLSDKFSISKERIRQIEERLKEKLKKFLEEKIGPTLKDAGY